MLAISLPSLFFLSIPKLPMSSIQLSVCPCIFVYVHVCISLLVCLSVCLSVCILPSLSLLLYIFLSVGLCPTICIYPCISSSISLSFHIFILLSVLHFYYFSRSGFLVSSFACILFVSFHPPSLLPFPCYSVHPYNQHATLCFYTLIHTARLDARAAAYTARISVRGCDCITFTAVRRRAPRDWSYHDNPYLMTGRQIDVLGGAGEGGGCCSPSGPTSALLKLHLPDRRALQLPAKWEVS